MSESKIISDADKIPVVHNVSTPIIDRCILCSEVKCHYNNNIKTRSNVELVNVCKCDNKKVHPNCLSVYSAGYTAIFGTHCDRCNSKTLQITRPFSYERLYQLLIGCLIVSLNIFVIYGYDYCHINVDLCDGSNESNLKLGLFLILSFIGVILGHHTIYVQELKYEYGDLHRAFIITRNNCLIQAFGTFIMYVYMHRINPNVLNWFVASIIIATSVFLAGGLILTMESGYDYFFPETVIPETVIPETVISEKKRL
jgi:hypothetical protein